MTRAVILGGSVTGLCAAGAVAPHFDEVVILERDVLPDDAEHRRGVPQSKHPHFVLNSGRRAMNALFPGFEDDLLAAGGKLLMPSYDAAYLEQPGWAPRKKSTMTMIYCSRILIERVLRDKVRALANVRIEEGVSVRGLDQAAGAITGVQFDETSLSADLVVDAMGRGSSVSDWLQKAGWQEAPVMTLDAKVTYVSRWYDLPAPEERPKSWWWKHIVIMPTQSTDPDRPPEHDFLSNFFPIDGDRVIACLGSWGQDMPKTADDFAAAAKRLRTPVFADAMAACEPTSEVHVTRSTGNKWRRYDRLTSAPSGLVFIGDSICAFNPFYAQGMSSASASAVLLGQMLAEGKDARLHVEDGAPATERVFRNDARVAEEIRGRNAIIGKLVTERKGGEHADLFLPDAIYMTYYTPMLVGIDNIRRYFIEHERPGEVAIDSLALSTGNIYPMDGGDLQLEQGFYVVDWRAGGDSGTVRGKSLNLWKRNQDGTLMLYRQAVNHD